MLAAPVGVEVALSLSEVAVEARELVLLLEALVEDPAGALVVVLDVPEVEPETEPPSATGVETRIS